MKKLRPIFFALFILAVWFVFSSPYFLQHKVPFPSTYQVNHFHPWSLYENFWGPVKNGAMPDIIDQIYPWRHFTMEVWEKGQIPLWDPNSFSGNPHLANFQSSVFSPFNTLFFILPFIDGWSIIILSQFLIAGFGTFFLLRQLKVSQLAACLAGIVYMFCGFIVVWSAYGTLSMAIVILPFSLLFLEKYYATKSKKYLILLSLSIAFSFFSGHFQTSFYFFLYVLIYFFYSLFKYRNTKDFSKIAFSLFLGIVISLIQILPSIQFYFNSVRSEIFIKSGGIPFYYLVTVFSPDFFGNPVTRNDWFGYYAEWSSFIGIIPLSLSFFAFNKNKNSFFFLIAGLLFLILALDTPMQMIIGYLKLPVLSTSNPTRIIVLFSFSFAVLSGFGLDNLLNLVSKKSKKEIAVRFITPGLLLIAAWTIVVFRFLPPDKIVIAKRNLFLPSMFYVLVSLSLIFTIYNHLKIKGITLYLGFLLLVLTSLDSLRFAQKWMPFDPINLVFVNLPVISAMQKNVGHGRVFGNLGAHVGTYYQIPVIEGYDPLYIGRYGEFVRSANTGNFLEAERSVVNVARGGKYTDRLLNILGVNLIYHPIVDTNQSWAYPVWKDKNRFTQVYSDNKFQLFRNNDVIPRGSIFYNYVIRKSKNEIINSFYSDNFDYKNTLILEEDPHLKTVNNPTGTVSYLLDTPNKIVMKVNTTSPALLFLSDNFYPGWKAFVNSKQTKIYRANYTLRAVIVGQGESIVEFSYFPI